MSISWGTKGSGGDDEEREENMQVFLCSHQLSDQEEPRRDETSAIVPNKRANHEPQQLRPRSPPRYRAAVIFGRRLVDI